MKRFLMILLSLLPAVASVAQSDTTITHGVAQDAPAPVASPYNLNGRNPIYYFGSPFAEHFAEVKAFFGEGDWGGGLSYTYLPEVWGWHVTGLVGFNSKWLTAGADCRLADPWNKVDVHFYGSLGLRYGENQSHGIIRDGMPRDVWRPAVDVGIRLAAPPSWGRFCYTSATLGAMSDFHQIYATIGLSTTITLLSTGALALGVLSILL